MSRIDVNAPKTLKKLAETIRADAARVVRRDRTLHIMLTEAREDAASLSRRSRLALDAWGRGEAVCVIHVGEGAPPQGLRDLPTTRWRAGLGMEFLAEACATCPPRPVVRSQAGVAPGSLSWVGLFQSIDRAEAARADALKPRRNYVFVSYARADADLIQPFVDAALGAGRKLWIDRTDLAAGALWPGEIVDAVRRCDTLALFASKRAFASDHVFREVSLAGKFKKPIVPVFLDGAKAPDAFLYYLTIHQAVRADQVGAPARFVAALPRGPRSGAAPLSAAAARATSSPSR